MLYAVLLRRLRALIVGALLVRLAPVLGRALHSAAAGLRRRGRAGLLAGALGKGGDLLLWLSRPGGRGRRLIG